MKNQYIGDIGDYGKYSLLRFLKDTGIEIGVNWYLTPDDGRTDGNHTEYLSDIRMRIYDPEVYDAMKRIAYRENKAIQMVEQNEILSGMSFYHEMMDFSRLHWRERPEARQRWHERAMLALRDASLIFADPDNSLSIRKKPTNKDAQKYILPAEISDYYHRNQQIMYYHHRSRKTADGWLKEKQQIKEYIPDAKLLALSFHRWNARTYIFVLHENKFDFYTRILKEFLETSWGTYSIDGKIPFSTESI